jgi:hypothetical protein
LDLTKIITELRTERDRIGRAIDALLDEAKNVVSAATRKVTGSPTRRGRGITAAGRRRLSEAMKLRWAARLGKGTVTKTPKKAAAPKKRRGLSAEGRKKISEAMKRRWAEKKKKAS